MLDGKTVSYKNMRGDLEEGEIIHVYSNNACTVMFMIIDPNGDFTLKQYTECKLVRKPRDCKF
jgi:hypothetical protein